MSTPNTDRRSLERLRAHYEVETELSDRLRRSRKEERLALYQSVYDELFRRVPDHPQLTRRASPAAQAAAMAAHVQLLRRFVGPNDAFMELGAGDCSLSLEVSRFSKRVYAVDVSAEITSRVQCPEHMQVIVSDGSSIPVPSGSVNIAFSHQLIEHMHVDDVGDHLQHVQRALVPGGRYVCITPHAMSGPHDISKHFDTIARGFHMKEYTNRELMDLFVRCGFARVQPLVGTLGRFTIAPAMSVRAIEALLSAFPHRVRRPLVAAAPLRQMLGIALVATKAS
jgi:ubiquinone/menaquinone biosynthesis C-methylase UbiE